jgi:hypothetical protein
VRKQAGSCWRGKNGVGPIQIISRELSFDLYDRSLEDLSCKTVFILLLGMKKLFLWNICWKRPRDNWLTWLLKAVDNPGSKQ